MLQVQHLTCPRSSFLVVEVQKTKMRFVSAGNIDHVEEIFR